MQILLVKAIRNEKSNRKSKLLILLLFYVLVNTDISLRGAQELAKNL